MSPPVKGIRQVPRALFEPTDNRRLPAKTPERSRPPRSDEDIVEAVQRLIRAIGKRCSTGDPDTASYLELLAGELDAAYEVAVAGWRGAGFTDGQIGRELGVTKQAVQKRWPRPAA